MILPWMNHTASLLVVYVDSTLTWMHCLKQKLSTLSNQVNLRPQIWIFCVFPLTVIQVNCWINSIWMCLGYNIFFKQYGWIWFPNEIYLKWTLLLSHIFSKRMKIKCMNLSFYFFYMVMKFNPLYVSFLKLRDGYQYDLLLGSVHWKQSYIFSVCISPV